MGINITQFSPPGTVSKLVWDDDMQPGAGKVFKGDLTGNVTGNVTGGMVGNITNGGVNGYLLRSGVVSASSGTLIVPAGSSTGNDPTTINLNGNGTYCIVGNTQKCYYPSPCNIPIVFGASIGVVPAYAESYTSDGILIQRITATGNLNIYNAAYIVLCGTQEWDSFDELTKYQTVSVADTYIDADTTITPGMVPPPTSGVFTGDVVGNVTGNLTGNVTGNVSGKTSYNWTISTDPDELGSSYIKLSASGVTQIYQLSPGDTMQGTIKIRVSSQSVLYLRAIDAGWHTIREIPLEAFGVYPIPAGTNGIYIRNGNENPVSIDIFKFVMS